MRKKMNDKGFTLVELIVVLVILAILAAILVPALLGYIDRARNQQYVLNAKSWLTATQAEFSAMYGAGKKPATDLDATRKTRIKETADCDCTSFSVEVGAAGGTNDHGLWTVKQASYAYEPTDGGKKIYLEFDGTEWIEKTETSFTKKTIKILGN